MVEVTQADRDATAQVWQSLDVHFNAHVEDGFEDDTPIVQAFACHREAAIAATLGDMVERDDLVERVARAMTNAVIRDDEGEFPRLFELLDFSGENKSWTVTYGLARAAIAAYEAAGVRVPPGWKLVPCEPTEAMLKAWFDAKRHPKNLDPEHFAMPAYRAMLAAAPTPPTGD